MKKTKLNTGITTALRYNGGNVTVFSEKEKEKEYKDNFAPWKKK